MHDEHHLETAFQRCGEEELFPFGAVAPPIFQTSLFEAESLRERYDHGGSQRYHYSRVGNPTLELAEKKLAVLEGTERALCFASGMGAISSAILTFLHSGDHVICVETVYPPTRELLANWLQRYGISVDFVSGEQVEAFEQARRPNTRMVYLESPSSIYFRLQDLAAVAHWAHQHGILTLCDNSWASPLFQNPHALGVDLVLHSASKYLAGHSDLVAGVVAGRADHLEAIAKTRELLGSTLEPFGAWLLIRGLRTLPLRMERAQKQGLTVAGWLAERPEIAKVNHPGLPTHPQHALAQRQMRGYGSLFSFETHPITAEQAYAFTDALTLFRFGPSWGGYESLLLGWQQGEPDTEGKAPWLFRIYIGLEHPDDLLHDLARALPHLRH